MEIINNKDTTLAEDLRSTLTTGSRLSIAAPCFSIYAYQELRKELEQIEELRFIFTSPTFIAEKGNKPNASFIFLVSTENEVLRVVSLKYSSAMN